MIPSQPRFWRFAAAANVGLALALAALWTSMACQGKFWRADFRAFYTGWAMVLDGEGERLYDLELQEQYQRGVTPELPQDQGLLPFVHPPHAAVAMSPLAELPRDAAFYLWAATQILLCVLGGRFILMLLPEQPPGVRRMALLTAAAFPPLFLTFQLGQVTLLCIVCVLGFVVALRDDQPLAMAVWILLGTVKPQIMVIPVVALLAQRRWRAMAWLFVLSVSTAALTTLALGKDCWTDYLALLRFCTQQFATSGIDPAGMYNLKSLLTVALGSDRAELINRLTTAAWLAGLAAALVLLWRKIDATTGEGRLALALLLGALVNPHVNPADVLAFVPPTVLFYAHLTRRGGATAFGVLAACAPWLFAVEYYVAGLPFRPFVLLGFGLCGWMGLSLVLRSSSSGVPVKPRDRTSPPDTSLPGEGRAAPLSHLDEPTDPGRLRQGLVTS